jgi:transposase
MGNHYPIEFKQKVLNDYYSGNFGGYYNVAKKYGLSHGTIWHWIEKDRKQGNQINDIQHKRGRSKKENIDYKERYEILKKYQAFIKAQREKK